MSARLGPMLSLTLGADLAGLPLLLEAGFARADFTSFGEEFHRNYGAFVLGSEWVPVRETVHVGLRLGLGAMVEDDISEDDPAFRSSNRWAEALVPGVVVRRPLAGGRALVFTVSDHIAGFWNALWDPDEYGVEHRLRVLVGVWF